MLASKTCAHANREIAMIDNSRNKCNLNSSTTTELTKSPISRRELFLSIIRNVAEKTETIINDSAIKKENITSWVKIGKVVDFPPDTSIDVNNGIQVLISRNNGFQAIDKEGTMKIKRPLKLDENGFLLMDPNGVWPENGFLSFMTRELIEEAVEVA